VTIVPVRQQEAKQFIATHHRHNKAPVGAIFCIGVTHEGTLVGVATVGRPVARMADRGYTAEVTRLCTTPEAPKGACSMMYAACWRAWRAMGGLRLITYTLKSESGASLRGAGWSVVAECAPKEWTCKSRVRHYQEVYSQYKLRWEVESANGSA
jgi:hypothetical protein